MGKSNRIRTKRANQKLTAPVTKQKKQMPSWVLSLITLVVAVAVLLSVVVGVMSANGTFLRMRTAAKTEDNRISGTMMSYFFWSTYENFTSENSSYMELFSLDSSKSLKDQIFGAKGADGTTYIEATVLGEFQGTWFDYFANETKEAVKSLLIYCEEAEKRGITLSDSELEEIETNLTALESTASLYGYSLNGYLQAMYGTGVKANDVRKAMELSSLANKCMVAVSDEYIANVTATEVANRYNENPKLYDLVDYTYFAYTVTWKEAATELLGADYTSAEENEKKAEILAKYKEMIADAKAKAEALAELTTEEEFKKAVLDYLVEKTYDELYAEVEIDEAELPAEDVRADIREKIMAQIKEDVLKEKEASDLVYNETGEGEEKVIKLFDHEITSAYLSAMEDLTSDLFEDVQGTTQTYFRTEIAYTEGSESSEWLFADERQVGDTTTILTGDGSKEEIADTVDVDNLDKEFSANAYIVGKTRYKDTSVTKNIAYMLFADEAAANTALEALKNAGTLSYEVFEKIANDNAADYITEIDDYSAGTLNADVLDTWLFADERKAGDYTAEVLKLSEGTWALAYFMADSQQQWYVDVRNEIASERMEAGFEALVAEFPVTFNDKTINKLDA